MRRFFHDTRGSAILWTLFLILILFTLSFVVYTGTTVYAKYQSCESKLERATVIAAAKNMENPNVRDANIDIPRQPALADLENNLAASGFVKSAGQSWQRFEGGKLIYEIRSLAVTVEDERMKLSGLFVMTLPWKVGGQTEVKIPITIQSRILFLE